MLTIDGSFGEGGGQIVRTSLALSLISGTPFRIEKLRAGRAKPGLMRQHLTAVKAAAQIGEAKLVGAEIGSQTIEFHPRDVAPGEYRFTIGTAGSATLVLQTVLPALLSARGPSTLVLEGGTHNPLAPTFDFLERVFLPLLRKMGVEIEAKLDRPGFYPAGGGRFSVSVKPVAKLARLSLLERGEIRARRATAMFSSLPFDIARRELATVRERLGFDEASCKPLEITHAMGAGNVVQIEIESEHATELFSAFGERGLAAEKVATLVCDETAAYLEANVPVGQHLADQLLLPMALSGGGEFVSLSPTPHTRTQMDIIERFIAVKARCEQVSPVAWKYEITSR